MAHPGGRILSKRAEYHRHIVDSVINLPRWNSPWGDIYSPSLQDSLNMVAAEMEETILVLLLHLGLSITSPSCKLFQRILSHQIQLETPWTFSVNSDIEDRCSLLNLELFFFLKIGMEGYPLQKSDQRNQHIWFFPRSTMWTLLFLKWYSYGKKTSWSPCHLKKLKPSLFLHPSSGQKVFFIYWHRTYKQR